MESVPRTAFEDHSRTLALARGVPGWIFLSSPATHSRRAAPRRRRTALAWSPMFERKTGRSSCSSPTSMRARGTIRRLTGSLSTAVAFPRQDPSPVQDVLREDQEDFRLIHEDHHLPPVADSGPRPPCLAGPNLV